MTGSILLSALKYKCSSVWFSYMNVHIHLSYVKEGDFSKLWYTVQRMWMGHHIG